MGASRYLRTFTLPRITPSTVYSMMDSRHKDVSAVTVEKLYNGLGISIFDFFSHSFLDCLKQEIE